MIRSRKAPLEIAVCMLLAFLPLQAQTYPDFDALRPYSAYNGGDIDSVGLTNGNLNVTAPLASYPQRGDLNLSFVLSYYNRGFKAEKICPFAGCTFLWYSGPLGFRFIDSEQLDAYVSQNLVCPGQGCSRGSNYQVFLTKMASGATHEMIPLSVGHRSDDGTGLYNDGNGVLRADGTRINLPAFNSSTWVVTREDRNGNQISTSSAGWKDTLGRIVPQPNTAPDLPPFSAHGIIRHR